MRSVPSPTALRRYLERFHDREEEERREPHRAFIPRPSEALRGLGRVNGDLLAFAQRHERQQEATLDMDATLIETGKRQALYSYQQTPAYQPLTTYWAEADVVLHSEFRDGNVPAGYEQLRVMQEAMQMLPPGVERVYMRSDTAGYQQELLRYCAEGRDPPSGLFGANAAWWAMVVLASNLNATFKRLLLPAEWAGKRHKAVRFSLIGIAGRVVKRSRRLQVQLRAGHPAYALLVGAPQRLRVLANAPP